MKKIFPILLVFLGVAFLVGGAYAVTRGFDARSEVKDELAQRGAVEPRRQAGDLVQHTLHGLAIAAIGNRLAAAGGAIGRDLDHHDMRLRLRAAGDRERAGDRPAFSLRGKKH